MILIRIGNIKDEEDMEQENKFIIDQKKWEIKMKNQLDNLNLNVFEMDLFMQEPSFQHKNE